MDLQVVAGAPRAGVACRMRIADTIDIPGAVILHAHLRPKDWKRDPKTGLLVPDYRWIDDPIMGRVADGAGAIDRDSAIVLFEEDVHNLLTNVGRVFMHTQFYATSGIGANGFNYIALTNDSGAPAAGDTTLASEITTNGLGRAQGTVTLASGSGNVTTVAKTFTATGSQSYQKGALFTAASVGTMNHEAALTARSLINGDATAITFTLTAG